MGAALNYTPSTTITNCTMHSPSSGIAQQFHSVSGSIVFMVFLLLLALHPGSVDSLQQPTHTMPRQRMRPRRGSPWHPWRPRTSTSPSGSSTQALEGLAIIDVFNTWWSSTAQHPPPPFAPVPGHRSKTNTPCPDPPREKYAILHDLVFELRNGVNDLHFWVQQLEGRLTVLLQLLANPPEASPEDTSDASLSDHEGSPQLEDTEGSLQSEEKTNTPTPRTDSVSLETPADNECDEADPVTVAAVDEQSPRLLQPTSPASAQLEADQNKTDGATEMQWTLSGGTPIIEEPWPGLLLEYVPDYTQLVPYFRSNGSQSS
jgi:hypothetical protein